jgi:hypothetical protein
MRFSRVSAMLSLSRDPRNLLHESASHALLKALQPEEGKRIVRV